MFASTMFRTIFGLGKRGHSEQRRTPGRPRTFRLQLEQLDERLVPSTLSSAISFYQQGDGGFGFTERDWYTVDRANGQVVEFTGYNRHNLGGPNDVFAVSASTDPNVGTGASEVFALTRTYGSNYGPLWLHDANGWHYFGGWYVDISATRDGHVYAVTLFGSSISYLDSNGTATDVGAPNGGVHSVAYNNSVAASVGWFGGNEVFAIGADHAIYVNSANAPGQWRLVNNQLGFRSLSATVNDTVFALSDGNIVYQATEHYNFVYHFYYWSTGLISPWWEDCWGISADTDANGRDEVYVIDSNGFAFLANQGSWTQKDSDVYDICGAGDGYFYDVNFNSYSYDAWLWNPYYGWIYLGSGLS
jgi:hypothetical protein